MKKSLRVCDFCGKEFFGAGFKCPTCYAYLRKHPEGLYPQPQYGEVLYAPNGDPVCHICRRAVRKLGNHIAFYHNMTQKEYREKFGLHHNTRLSNGEYIDKMRTYSIDNYDLVIAENLIEGGINTRTTHKNCLPGRKIGNNKIKLVYYGEES